MTRTHPRHLLFNLWNRLRRVAGARLSGLPGDISRIAMPSPADPSWPEAEFERALEVCWRLAETMERHPASFAPLGEQAIRDHFLAQLNGHYRGGASGEAFNYSGKTDILVQSDGRVLLIAECKFWSGSKHFLETVDQLFRYVTSRDTRVAVLVFSRTQSLSKVRGKLHDSLARHGSFLRYDEMVHPGVRVVLRHPRDSDAEIAVSVLAFDVPRRP